MFDEINVEYKSGQFYKIIGTNERTKRSAIVELDPDVDVDLAMEKLIQEFEDKYGYE